MKLKKKRFHSRKAIIEAIDERQHSLDMDIKLARQYESELDDLRAWFAVHDLEMISREPARVVWHGKYKRLGDCKRELEIRKRAMPRHHSILEHLKSSLAEFDTAPMAFLDDSSVQLK